MRRSTSFLLSVAAVLLVVPRYDGAERLPTIRDRPMVTASPYVPAGGWPDRIGALAPVGGLTLSSSDPAFGGFSALALHDGRAHLLSDGGNLVTLAVRGGTVREPRGHVLRQGPGVGWDRRDRDSESLTLDPRTGRAWVGYETHNQIWRYAPGYGHAERHSAPAAMRRWEPNLGAESLVRLRTGAFLTFAERKPNRRTRHGLLFTSDPTVPGTKPIRFLFQPPDRYDPSDAAELPNGDLLVLTRRFQYPFRFTAKLVRISRAHIRPNAVVSGKTVATLAPPVLAENAEGLAITQERGETMVWIVTDNDAMALRPTYLLKLRWPRSEREKKHRFP
ncbi:esterase-like activity of phytase family protein [Sphingomonas sp.]|uniref:esterase-like activity of phytase family protein n=1 Tax=Sphingomonas sp. TaxID=28214 RepID=UPI00261FD470|nr:esterase-like activity of phytase family protein [Sphingomonas sp.]